LPKLRNETELVVLALLGSCVYGTLALALFGRQWISLLRRRTSVPVPPATGFEVSSSPGSDPV
jgi:hypothetical protein